MCFKMELGFGLVVDFYLTGKEIALRGLRVRMR